jgi:CBS domain-containing protein
MLVKEIMTEGVACARPGDSIALTAERMRDLNVGSLPVCGENRLIGMITDRDITIRGTAEGCSPDQITVNDCMTPDITWCFDDDDIRQAAHLMEENQIRRLAVLDHNKRLVGILSLGDLAVKADGGLSGEALECVSEPAMPDR